MKLESSLTLMSFHNFDIIFIVSVTAFQEQKERIVFKSSIASLFLCTSNIFKFLIKLRRSLLPGIRQSHSHYSIGTAQNITAKQNISHFDSMSLVCSGISYNLEAVVYTFVFLLLSATRVLSAVHNFMLLTNKRLSGDS